MRLIQEINMPQNSLKEWGLVISAQAAEALKNGQTGQIREWGRVGSSGQLRIDHHPDEGRAVDALADLVTAKRKRGYR